MRSHKIRGSGDENDLFFKAGELNARMSGLFLIGLFSTGDLPLERTVWLALLQAFEPCLLINVPTIKSTRAMTAVLGRAGISTVNPWDPITFCRLHRPGIQFPMHLLGMFTLKTRYAKYSLSQLKSTLSKFKFSVILEGCFFGVTELSSFPSDVSATLVASSSL